MFPSLCFSHKAKVQFFFYSCNLVAMREDGRRRVLLHQPDLDSSTVYFVVSWDNLAVYL